jgi:hypothetical protein
MIKEYSNEIRGKVHAYRFQDWEKNIIAESLKPVIKKLEKKIYKIDNNPKNEGQVTFWEFKRELINEIKVLTEIINDFSQTKKPNQ